MLRITLPLAMPAIISNALFVFMIAWNEFLFALLFLVLRPLFGEQAANFLALLVTAIANTGVNRWFTFGVTGRVGAVRHQVQGLVVFALAWSITSGSLVALHAAMPQASAAEFPADTMKEILYQTPRVTAASMPRRARPPRLMLTTAG